jgi:hypothetical protein
VAADLPWRRVPPGGRSLGREDAPGEHGDEVRSWSHPCYLGHRTRAPAREGPPEVWSPCRAHTLVLRRGRVGMRGAHEREGREEERIGGRAKEGGGECRWPTAWGVGGRQHKEYFSIRGGHRWEEGIRKEKWAQSGYTGRVCAGWMRRKSLFGRNTHQIAILWLFHLFVLQLPYGWVRREG